MSAYKSRPDEYQAIPFRLSLTLSVFSKCVEATLFPLWNSGIRIFSYIHDYLICSHSREQAVKESAMVINYLTDFGFNLYWRNLQITWVSA